MSPAREHLPSPSSGPPPEDSTGLPGFRRWRNVYAVVFGVLVLWIALLTWLTVHFA